VTGFPAGQVNGTVDAANAVAAQAHAAPSSPLAPKAARPPEDRGGLPSATPVKLGPPGAPIPQPVTGNLV
jgi:hypothetical protein